MVENGKDLKMKKLTKTSVTLSVMTANADKPMADVVQMILEAQHAAGFSDVTLKICEGAYRWAVRKGMAPGVVPTKQKTVKSTAKKTVKSTSKTKKEAVALVAKPTAPTKTPEEIERIKAGNLARLKEIAARNKLKNNAARIAERAAEVAIVDSTDHDDPFSVPTFLTKDQLKYIV
jgi:hypothetical protein